MKIHTTIVVVLLLFSIRTEIYPQNDSSTRIYRTNTDYKIEDWIGYTSTRWIRSVAVGTQKVYAATSGGIVRYDHYTHRWDYPWTTANGLASNDVYLVAFDEGSYNVWCATDVSVSCYFSTFHWWENYYFDEQGMPVHEPVYAIGLDEQDVWIEFANHSIYKGNKQGGGFFQQTDAPDADESQSIQWFGLLENRNDELPQFFMEGTYWFDNDGFIQDQRFNKYGVSSWLLDKWGKYWIGTKGLGLGTAEVRIDQLELLEHGLWVNNVSAMALDSNSDVMWFGGMGEFLGESGITSWDRQADEWKHYQAKYIMELRNDQVTAIAVDGPWIWFATEFGLARYNPRENEWKTYDLFSRLADNYIYDVAIGDSDIWVATANGLSYMSKATLQTGEMKVKRMTQQALHTIPVFDVEIMHNLIWLGTENGVFIYDKNKNVGGFQAASAGPMDEPVYAASVYNNEAWFGTETTVEVFNIDKKEWLGVPYRLTTGVNHVNFIRADKRVVWVATDDGVFKFDRDAERWIHFTIEDGLLHNQVTSIVLDGDYVWFGGPEGTTRFYWNAPYRID